MKLTAALEQEQESNQKRLHDLAMMQGRADAQESEVRTFIKEIRRYAAIEELDEAVPVSYTHLGGPAKETVHGISAGYSLVRQHGLCQTAF